LKKRQIYEDIFTDPIVTTKHSKIQEDVERVRATFDRIGSLFDIGLIPETPLLKGLWGTGSVLDLSRTKHKDRTG
jgi:hypothetical protein